MFILISTTSLLFSSVASPTSWKLTDHGSQFKKSHDFLREAKTLIASHLIALEELGDFDRRKNSIMNKINATVFIPMEQNKISYCLDHTTTNIKNNASCSPDLFRIAPVPLTSRRI